MAREEGGERAQRELEAVGLGLVAAEEQGRAARRGSAAGVKWLTSTALWSTSHGAAGSPR